MHLHLEKLQSRGFEIPDAISENEIGSGKLGGFRPWAWSPEASQLFKPFAQQVSKKVKDQWRPPVPGLWLSKEIGYLLEKRIGSLENNRSVCRDVDHALSIINSNLSVSCRNTNFKFKSSIDIFYISSITSIFFNSINF